MTAQTFAPFFTYAWNLPMDVIKHPLTAVRDHLQYRKTVRTLNALSDRMLEDIGLARSDIEIEARRQVYAF
jgi:uncharacterized protein YjiS (DUF1127 family)